jgi:hypothetical protein
MNKNIDLLLPRIIDSTEKVNYEEMISCLKKIKDSCICTGTGGSFIASEYAKEVIGNKNDVIALNLEPRDLLYSNIRHFNNLCAFSYGGNNYGINQAIGAAEKYKMHKAIFTSNDSYFKDMKVDTIINYKGDIEKEVSFISMASTLIPMSLFLKYYLNEDINFKTFITTLYNEAFNDIGRLNCSNILNNNLDIDIMTGDNTYCAAKMLESTLVEAGLGRPLLHEKYSYCHGRTTLAFHHKPSLLVYLINGTKKEIDDLLLNSVGSLYERVLLIKSNEKDKIIGEFELVLKMLFLSKKIALNLDKDLSIVDYAPQVKKIY